MTNAQLIQTYQNLLDLRKRADVRFPARTSFAITRNLKLLEPIAASYYQTRDEVIHKYGVPADNPGDYTIPQEFISTAMDELSSLDSMEVEVNFVKVKLNDLDTLDLSLQDMDALYNMIEEE